MSVWPHAAFSQRATWPPSATVRQRSIALITFNWSRLTWPRLASRQAGTVEPQLTALSRRRLLNVSLCVPVARRAQARERALDLGDYSCRHAGVSSRRVELVVSKQRLNQPNVRAVLEQMGCEGMAQRMKRDRLAQPRGFRRLLEQPTELARRRRLTISATGKQPALFRRNAGVTPGRPRLPPLPQQIEDFGRKHHMSVLAAFRLHDADDHLLTVDVARSQPHHFAGPQPATIRERQHRARLEARRHGQNTLDLLGAQYRRQLLRLLHVPDLGRQIVATQRDAEQEAHPGHDPIAVADAGAALDEAQLEEAHLLGRRCIGRAFEPRGEPLAAIDVAALRVRVEHARSHVFDHTLTQRTDSVGLAHRALLPEWVERPSILRTGLPVAPSLSYRLATRPLGSRPRAAGRSAATSCPGATDVFSRRPLSRAYRPFIGPILKGSSGEGFRAPAPHD